MWYYPCSCYAICFFSSIIINISNGYDIYSIIIIIIITKWAKRKKREVRKAINVDTETDKHTQQTIMFLSRITFFFPPTRLASSLTLSQKTSDSGSSSTRTPANFLRVAVFIFSFLLRRPISLSVSRCLRMRRKWERKSAINSGVSPKV